MCFILQRRFKKKHHKQSYKRNGKIFMFHIMNKRLIFPKHKDYLLETAKNTNDQEENEARTKIPSQEIHLVFQKL